MNAKKLLLDLIIILPFLVVFSLFPAKADEIVTVEEFEESQVSALCKSGTHKTSFIYQGAEKAWVKITMTNACWSACGIKLDNSTHTKWAAPGWAVTWSNSSLGGRSCKFDSFKRFSDATINAPPGVQDYISHQESWLKFQEPLDLNWSSWRIPVIIK